MGICCYSKPMKEVQLTAVAFQQEMPDEEMSPEEISDEEMSPDEFSDEEMSPEGMSLVKYGRALYSLQPKGEAILHFSKGDTLIIEDDSDPDWYLARHPVTKRKGFVPKTYLSMDIFADEPEWFFEEITKLDALRLLLQPENIAGTFMVRNCTTPGAYALSIKEIIPDTNEVEARHYKINILHRGGFFISKQQIFNTLQQLVAYYTENADGLCRKLEKACPKPRPAIPWPLPNARDEYEIIYDNLQFIRHLGKGKFSEVFYGYWNGTTEVAIKRLLNNDVQSNDFRREVAVVKAISHPKIVRLFAICTEKEPFCIVMEYMCHGNLRQYLKSEHGKQLKLPSLVHMAAQISDGMKYLESEKLVHRDLTARNILVDDGDIVKLADFGLARIFDEETYMTIVGKVPVKWTAPEAFVSGEFTIKSDVWSFGIVLYEIFTHGEMPYPGMKNIHIVELLKRNYRMPKPDDSECSESVYDTMVFCWKKNPDDRPTFEYLFHFFTDYYVTSEKSHREVIKISLDENLYN